MQPPPKKKHESGPPPTQERAQCTTCAVACPRTDIEGQRLKSPELVTHGGFGQDDGTRAGEWICRGTPLRYGAPSGAPLQRRRLEEVAKAVGGGYRRLQMPLKPALVVQETVAGHGLDALKGGGMPPPPSNASLPRGKYWNGRTPSEEGVPPPHWTRPPPDQSDHRGKTRNLQSGKSGGAIVGTQTFGPVPPPPPLLMLPCPPPPPHSTIPNTRCPCWSTP